MATHRNIHDNLFIEGKTGQSIAKIEKPSGKKLTLTGTVDIVDQFDGTGNDEGMLLINGVDYRHTSPDAKVINIDLAHPTGEETILTASDPTDIEVYLTGVSTNVSLATIVLPQVTTGTKKIFKFTTHGTINETNACYYIFANGEGTASSDVIDDKVETVDSKEYSSLIMKYDSSVELQSVVGTYTNGTTNGWKINSQYDVNDTSFLSVSAASIADVADIGAAIGNTSLDGHTLNCGENILVKSQTADDENGIYVVGNATIPTMRLHGLATGDPTRFHNVHVENGTVNTNKTFKGFGLLRDGAIGTDSLEYVNSSFGLYSEITQGTSTSTAVNCNCEHGTVTCFTSTQAAEAVVTFSVNNNWVNNASDIVLANIVDYSGTTGLPTVRVDNVADGNFDVKIQNCHSSAALNGILKISFLVISYHVK